jgi:hypothetical protein
MLECILTLSRDLAYIGAAAPINPTCVQLLHHGINHTTLETSLLTLLQEAERPAHLQIPEYRDAFGRHRHIYQEHNSHDHFLRSYDGRLDLLRVQVVDLAAFPNEPSLGWIRVKMSTKTTPLNRVLYWTWSSTQARSAAQRDFIEYPYNDVVFKWIPSCIALLVLVS